MEEVAMTGKSSLLSVGPDPIRIIFQYLTIKERIRLERVSKAVQSLSRATWSQIQEINLSWFAKAEEAMSFPMEEEDEPYCDFRRADALMLKEGIIESIWSRCRAHIFRLKFSRQKNVQFNEKSTEEILTKLGEAPANRLRELNLGDLTFGEDGLKLLSTFIGKQAVHGGPPIKVLDFEESLCASRLPDWNRERTQEIVEEIIGKCPHLTSFTALHSNVSLGILQSLPECLETLRMETSVFCGYEQQDDAANGDFLGMEKPMPALKNLYFAKVVLQPVSLSGITVQFPSLRVLDLSYVVVRNAAELKELSLEELYLNESFAGSWDWGEARRDNEHTETMKVLSDPEVSRLPTSLRILQVNDCFQLEPEALKCVSAFTELEELSLEGDNVPTNPEIMDKIFSGCSKLEALTVRHSAAFDDQCLLSLGERCPNISYLDISYCSEPTETGLVTMISALESNKNRRNAIPINIYCLNTVNLDGGEIEGLGSEDSFNSGSSVAVKVHAHEELPPKRYKYATDPHSFDDETFYGDYDSNFDGLDMPGIYGFSDMEDLDFDDEDDEGDYWEADGPLEDFYPL